MEHNQVTFKFRGGRTSQLLSKLHKN